eukprot:TRINITY_DN6892_c0_g1_i1.p1 TRINITY_DN6892_c0_g1~~TRINITY_DN6892_c0_g1_i1.p1  ORF type:complete len:342 (+),score=51.06 TRINITY_DN6892_c0_g1_i1:154-1026(+)
MLDTFKELTTTRGICSCFRIFTNDRGIRDHLSWFPGHQRVALVHQAAPPALAAAYIETLRRGFTCPCGEGFPTETALRQHVSETRHPIWAQAEKMRAENGQVLLGPPDPTPHLWSMFTTMIPPKLQCDCGFPNSPRFRPWGHHWCRYWGRFQCLTCDRQWTSNWVWYSQRQRCSTCRIPAVPVEVQRLAEDLEVYPEEGPHPAGKEYCSMCRLLRRDCSRLLDPLPPWEPEDLLRPLKDLVEDPSSVLTDFDRVRMRRLIARGPDPLKPLVMQRPPRPPLRPHFPSSTTH